ncbi:hypothetical protein [Cerasicoccus frondis]|uniref:hypothetical protein n=1 Tax=Cerasicoccus frondis TaxID=490090 RepID=UPI00285259C8|nr:hypothetical protein [Cerasicoccus frondis]
MDQHATIPTHTQNNLPRWATADELCEAFSIKDRRVLDKLGIKRARISRRCVRYDVAHD